jgi:hypothetical protein
LESLPAKTEIFHADENFPRMMANMVIFQVMDIFPENIEVWENLPAKTEIFHADENFTKDDC